MKPISFADYKRLMRLPLNQFNQWVIEIYKQGFKDGVDRAGEVVDGEIVAQIAEDDLRELLLSVKGIGEKRSDSIMRKILEVNHESNT